MEESIRQLDIQATRAGCLSWKALDGALGQDGAGARQTPDDALPAELPNELPSHLATGTAPAPVLRAANSDGDAAAILCRAVAHGCRSGGCEFPPGRSGTGAPGGGRAEELRLCGGPDLNPSLLQLLRSSACLPIAPPFPGGAGDGAEIRARPGRAPGTLKLAWVQAGCRTPHAGRTSSVR